MPQMTENTKKKLWSIFAVALVTVFAVWMILSPSPEHIEDTNGPDDYSLQQINEEDVVSLKMGSRGTISQRETKWDFGGFTVSDGIKYSSGKFTGVYQLYSCTLFKGSDIHVYLGDFQVSSGNFAFYVVFDGKIVGQVRPDAFGMGELIIENVEKTGVLQYIIAGESANFCFTAPTGW